MKRQILSLKNIKNPSTAVRQPLGKQKQRTFASSNYSNHYKFKQSPRVVQLPTPAKFYSDVVESLIEKDDGWAWGCCPFHLDTNPSLCMNLESGFYKCMSSNCGKTGNNIVSFVGALHSLTKKDAITFLESLA